MTLLETILAAVILALAMAAVGELIRTGIRAASKSQDLALAQMIAESRMAEVLAGAAPASSSAGEAYSLDPEWQTDTLVESLSQPGLLSVTVVAYRGESESRDGVEYSLTQWMIDPALALEDVVAAELAAAAASGTTTSGSSTGSSGTGTSGTGSSGTGSTTGTGTTP